ncbi:MAG TPA: prolipoprotein diacylglyceryl transferase [Candidatus Anaerofilum faecale]|nr:prolipoprotein diacylglyceryl transferase [Candidatus Anaerofilum faecale]
MNFHVEFPGLGLEFDISRVAFYIGSVPIYWYGIVIGLGFALALVFAFANAKRFGIDADRMSDVIILTTICAVLCARAYYVIFAPFEYQSFWDMINIRDGGLAIYGGVIGAVIFGILFSKWRKVPVLPMLDLAAMGFLIGQGLGRWGNFFNQEAFGTNTTLPWGMHSDGTAAYLSGVQSTLAAQGITVDPSMPVHPTFLYESIWCLLGFVLLALYIPRRRFHGEIALMYAAWYGAERCLVEGLRTDSLMLGGVRISQLVAGVSVVAALALLICLRRKYRNVPLVIPALPGEQKSPELVEIEEETMVPAAEEETVRPEQAEPVQEEEEEQ